MTQRTDRLRVYIDADALLAGIATETACCTSWRPTTKKPT
jgi:hypothetical protein